MIPAVREHLRSFVTALGRPELAACAEQPQRLREALKDLPEEVWLEVRAKVSAQYERLEDRYGRGMALAIISSAILGTAVPLPGTTVIAAAPLLALAELHYRLWTAASDSEAAEATLTAAEVHRRGKRFLQNLTNRAKR
jgi:hypothetical protein